MKKLTIGILAHVDAGKTTLSEALLYLSGKIRSLGRVDRKNTFLDTDPIERERGITVFSKQARFSYKDCEFVLLDTPGHVDFSAETERTLSLLDYAILVISAPDGVQNHTRTLWQLLEFYDVPTFIFVNKNDISTRFKDELEQELCQRLSKNCVGFFEAQSKAELDEKLALVDESFLDSFLEGVPIDNCDIAELVSRRRLFPVVFGAALRLEGVETLLDTVNDLTLAPRYDGGAFGAKVYKISRASSTRLTYMKVTSGSLRARDEIIYLTPDGKRCAEKVSGIRLYSGDRFEQADTVSAGEICAVTGLSSTFVGQGLGNEENSRKPILEPVLSCAVELPKECDPVLYLPKFKELEEEEPSLHIVWNDELRRIEARLMGEIQTDLIKRLASDRFGISCEFGAGEILYKEKPAASAVGVGHFEPLRHYAEVQLLIEPLPKGSGLVFDSRISESELDKNHQRLVLSNLYEKNHRGTLTGALLTDAKISLVAGKAHLKHTEGGDFREATLRAVRHGLMKSGCVLLEPYYKFTAEIPSQSVGRVISDLQTMSAEFEIDSSSEEFTVIKGRAPVSELGGYTSELISFTSGRGRLFCVSDGYEPCHNADEIIEKVGYDPAADTENTPHSVFCAHGAGFVVPWNEVDSYKHLEPSVSVSQSAETIIPRAASLAKKYDLSNEELEAIMLREFGPIRRKQYSEPKVNSANGEKKPRAKKISAPQKKLLIVDGYNLIYSWDALKGLANESLEKAREVLMDTVSNYVAFTKVELVLVFDAYLVKDGIGSEFERDGYRVVYTKENQTADAYIEEMMHRLGPNYNVTVVTGDRLLQFSAVHSGVLRMTAAEFLQDVTNVANQINEFVKKLAECR